MCKVRSRIASDQFTFKQKSDLMKGRLFLACNANFINGLYNAQILLEPTLTIAKPCLPLNFLGQIAESDILFW